MDRRTSRVRPPNQTFNDVQPHPSTSSHAYSDDMRALAIANRLSGADGSREIRNLQRRQLYPNRKTVDRWVRRYNTFGHARSYRRTGNHRARREIRGRNLILLSLYRTFRPTAMIAECNAFLFQMNRNNFPNYRFHSPSQIHRAESLLCLTRVRSSTSAWQVGTPRIQQWQHNYWHHPYPYGVANIASQDVIDIDEAGVHAENVNRNEGKTLIGHRCRSYGFYGRNAKINLLLAISGDAQAGRWFETWQNEGTTIFRFIDFIQRILNDIGPGTAQRRFCFTMDNLNVHTNGHVVNLILSRGHRVVFRAPYCAADGAIEYVFNAIESELRVDSPNITDMPSLERRMIGIIRSIPVFTPFFNHVGFR